MTRSRKPSHFLILAVFCSLSFALAAPELWAQRRFSRRGGVGPAKKKTTPGKPKKYDDVITKDAKTFPGVFLVHRVDEKIYFEIPKDALGKLMLWTIEVAKGPPGVSWGGRSLGSRVIRWERRGNKVYLWNATFEKRAGGNAIQKAVDSANMDTIIMAFDVAAEGKDRSSVIQVESLFLKDMPDFSIRRAVQGASAVDAARSYVEQVKAFPRNIEIRSAITFRGGSGGGGSTPGGRRIGGRSGGKSYTAVLHYSIVQLPDNPMMGRYFDSRVGFFTRSFEDYSGKRGWMENRKYIARFRLEKKDPKAEISEPVKPIVFYLSREVPEKWRPYLMKGVEDWKPAFEQAGFKNAIICKQAPTRREDPSWDAEDARHSVIRWVADPTQNAMGPHVDDPRSGEVISAHIIFWHDITRLVQEWYFIQCGATDPRVKKLPLPDEVTGECLRNVACHEVGHTLGLRHNHRASQAYSIAQLRDPKFTDKHGTTASIMSYGRFNYVAQPGDNVKRFIPVVGPYDKFAIHWGYAPIPGTKSPADETATLDKWAARQMTEPFLRFGGEDGPSTVDPTVLTENISNDRIESTRLGLKNLKIVLKKLVAATTNKGEDFSLLEDTYRNVLRHRSLWLAAVAKQVGGVVETRTLGGRGKESFTRIPYDEQSRAVQFLLTNAFQPPRELLDPAIVNRFKYQGVAGDVMAQQKSLLRSLLSKSRFARLFDAAVLEPESSYSAMQFLNDLQSGIWSELAQKRPKIVPLRRALQRAYVAHLKSELADKKGAVPVAVRPRRGRSTGAPGSNESDFRAVARAALQNLAELLDKAIPQAGDPITQAHLRDCRRELKTILNPKE
jgi:Met-zincin/Domain of unknown function (DUF5117)/Domain of unknown function (DUF5118)